MTELKSRIHDKSNGLDYVLVGDYYVPDLKLPEEHQWRRRIAGQQLTVRRESVGSKQD